MKTIIIIIVIVAILVYLFFNTPKWLEKIGSAAAWAIRK